MPIRYIELEKPVLVKVIPPKDRTQREKLRVLIEGKRATMWRRVYRAGGLLKKVNGGKVAPWVYLIPRKNLPAFTKSIESIANEIKIFQI
jgi:hypothetical protein